jgi:asparagine synthase (glutamine-hydrolysing)
MGETIRGDAAAPIYSASSDSGVCQLGQVSLPQFAAVRTIASAGDSIAVLDGEILNRAELRPSLAADTQRTSDAQLVLDGYSQAGREFFARLEGKFVIALWDSSVGQLFLVSDRFGMKPVYYHHGNNGFSFASGIKALLSAVEGTPPIDFEGVSLFLSYGQLFANSTMVSGIRVLPEAGILTFDAKRASLQVERYWRPAPKVSSGQADLAGMLERLDSAFQKSIDRSVRDTPNLGISLSGGLDGRAIMAGIDHAATPLTSLCLGMAGSLDHRAARQIAELTNRRHSALVLDKHFLESYPRHLISMVRLTDGHYLDQGIVMPTLAKYRELGVDVLLRGHAGELFHLDKAYNFSVDSAFQDIADDAGLLEWCSRRLPAFMMSGLDRPLIQGMDLGEIRRIAQRALKDCFEDSAYLESKYNRLTHLFLGQRIRRETAMSMTIFGSVVETRIPYLDRDVVEAVMALPGSARIGDKLQSYIIGRRCPALLRVANSNTGARMGAPKWIQQAALFRMKLLGRLGVKGYQPYERLGLWLRRELASFVREILLSGRCRERGLFVPDTLQWIVDEHLTGRRNFTYLIQALLIVELGQRLLFDRDPNSDESWSSLPACADGVAC